MKLAFYDVIWVTGLVMGFLVIVGFGTGLGLVLALKLVGGY